LSLARALAQRVRWEQETGAAGYAPQEAPPPIVEEPSEQPGAALLALRAEIGDCTRCPLAAGRTKLVFGEGSPRARLVFVGEGPGRDEDLSGRPFVGAAGQLLDRIIAAIGLARDDVYICNVVKCRPPGNRDPLPEETAVCGRFVRRQLEIIRPEVVVALGRPAAQYLLDTEQPIGRLRGRFHELGETSVMPTFHPAYLLRNAEGKRPVWEDMKQVRDRLGLTSPPR
jgi:DNA polymerase